jgi:hypothetical protein
MYIQQPTELIHATIQNTVGFYMQVTFSCPVELPLGWQHFLNLFMLTGIKRVEGCRFSKVSANTVAPSFTLPVDGNCIFVETM